MQSTGMATLARLRSRITQEVDASTLNKVKRWAAACLCIAFAMACVVFGVVYSWRLDVVFAVQQSFAYFWMAFGVSVFVSTWGIAKWLGEREG